MENGDCRLGHSSRSKSNEKEFFVTCLDKTCRQNEGNTPTLCSKYTAESERRNTAKSLVEIEKSRSKHLYSDRSDHKHDFKSIVRRQKKKD